MFPLDNRTILVCLVIVGFLTSIFSFVPYKKYKLEQLKGFRMANVSYILGFGILQFQGILPTFITVIVSNTFIVLSFIVFINLILGLFNIRNNYKIDIFILIINTFLFLFFLYVEPNTYIRIVVISVLVNIVIVKGIIKLIKYYRNDKQIILIVYISSLLFYTTMLTIRVIITTQLNYKIDSIFKIDIATALIFISTIAYHLSVNFVIFIRLLNIYEYKLENKVKLIKKTHSDMKDINGLIINSEKYTLNADFYEKVSDFIRKRFNVSSLIIYNLNEELNLLKMVSFTNVADDALDYLIKLPVNKKTITGKAVLTSKPQFIRIEDYPNSNIKKVLKRENFKEIMSYPIKTKKGVIGAFTLGIKEYPNYIREDHEFFSLICDQIGTIIENISLYEKLDDLATKDALTQISNRRNFNLLFDHVFLKSKRYKTNLAVIMIDIDYFKSVNDTHGHQAGDKVLMQVVKVIKNQLRDSDIIARFGGEEFVILLEDCLEGSVIETAERIRKSVMGSRYDIGSMEIDITVSLGIAIGVPDENSKSDFLRKADEALYIAKRDGRNRVQLFEN